MPQNLIPGFIKRLVAIESSVIDVNKHIVQVQTDVKWLKWIIVGAAGLGFLEKIFGWLVK